MQFPEARNFKTPGMGRILWAVILLSVIARISLALYQGNEVTALPGTTDQISYHRLSMRVLEGHGFSFDIGWWPATPAGEPTAHWSYLYVLFLTAVYALFGPNPIAARLIQSILVGILQPLLIWRIGRRLFGPKIGMVSALFSAVYAYFIFYGGSLMTESFYITAILWALDIATAMAAKPAWHSGILGLIPWIQLGLACSLAVLLRQAFLLLVPVILLWLFWRLAYRSHTFSISNTLSRTAIVLAILIACIAPWTVRNYRVFNSFVLLNTNAGFAFFWGNHPIHRTEFVPILPPAEYGALIPEELRGLNEAEMDKGLLLRGFRFVREDPLRYVLLSISRVKEYIRFWPSSDSGIISNYMRIFSFGLLFPLVLSGLCLLSFFYSRNAETGSFPIHPGSSLLLLVGGFYTLVHLMTWTLIRYRLPVDAIFIPFAAISAVAGCDYLAIIARKHFRKSTKQNQTMPSMTPDRF